MAIDMMSLGNTASLPSVMDLSQIGKIKRDSVCVLGLLDGTRIIAQKISEDAANIILEHPLRLIIQPVSQDSISLRLIDFIVGASPDTTKVSIKLHAVICEYLPDNDLIDGYADHVARKQTQTSESTQ